jgi:uncharacterized delta-60 repeat protein
MKDYPHRSLTLFAGILALVLLFGIALTVRAAPGNLDPTFHGNGMVVADFRGQSDSGNAVAIDDAGRIVVAGHVSAATKSGNFDFALARYLPDGKLDATFGSSGMVVAGTAQDYETAYGVALDSLGRIVVAGDFRVARFSPDGAPDATFDGDGMAVIPFRVHALAVDSADRIVVAGIDGSPWVTVFALARYDTTGSLDPSFGSDGEVTTDFGGGQNAAYAVTLDEADRSTAAGYACTLGACDFAVARYNADGSPDTTFDGDGMTTTEIAGRGDYPTAMTLDDASRIIVAGYASTPGTDFALVRYGPDGGLDPSFGIGGKVITDFAGFPDSPAGVAVDEAGRIVVAGKTSVVAGMDDGIVARYTPAGSLDTTFGDQGKVYSGLDTFRDFWGDVVVDDANRIVTVGRRTNPDWSNSVFIVARYEGDELVLPPLSGIDIMPGDPLNVISLNAGGAIQVAVLSGQDFQAPTQILPHSLTFGRTGSENSLLTRANGDPDCAAADVNADGQADLVCRFLIKLTGFRTGDMGGVLRGMTTSGAPFEGADMVTIVP